MCRCGSRCMRERVQVANMDSLRYLWLDWNEIRRLPLEMRHMDKVQQRVATVPPSLQQLTPPSHLTLAA